VTWNNKGPWAVVTDAAQWSAMGYTINNNGYTGSDGTLCSDFLNAIEAVLGYWHTAFPNAMLSVEPNGSNIMPLGTYSGSDPAYAALFAYDKATYPQAIMHQNNELGCQSTTQNVIFIPASNHLDFGDQPFVSIGFQEYTSQANITTCGQTGGTPGCNAGGLYSTSSSNCIPPSVYAALPNQGAPYIEAYKPSATSLWYKLVHDLAWGR
jgi:hypothetical protein